MKQRSGQRGLTLLETLVTLVIVAIVAGLMSEGMYQLGRVEQRLGSGQLQAKLGRLHLIWVRQAIEGLQPAELDTPERFQGDSRSFQAVSSMLPTPARQGAMPMRLSLAYRAASGHTELSLQFGLAEAGAPAVVLAHWPGDEGSFSYLDGRGQWVADWPPSSPTAPLLPRAVAIRQQDGAMLLVAAPQAIAQPLGKRIDVSKMP